MKAYDVQGSRWYAKVLESFFPDELSNDSYTDRFEPSTLSSIPQLKLREDFNRMLKVIEGLQRDYRAIERRLEESFLPLNEAMNSLSEFSYKLN